MAQNLEFSYTSGQTLTAVARAIGVYTGGTNADSVTHQAGTDRYLAAFASNLAAGTWRLDYLVSGTCVGSQIFDVNGNGTYQPRSELAFNNGDIDGLTVEQALKIILAVLAGKLSGAATTTIAIRAADDSKTRVTATVDSNGNRSSLTLDATG